MSAQAGWASPAMSNDASGWELSHRGGFVSPILSGAYLPISATLVRYAAGEAQGRGLLTEDSIHLSNLLAAMDRSIRLNPVVMKTAYLVGVLMILVLSTPGDITAQQRSLSLKAGYPLTVGETFLSEYDGIAGGELIYNYPLSQQLLFRPAVGYKRLGYDRTGVTANLYSVRVGFGYSIALMRSLRVIPEAGVGYTRFSFQASEEAMGSNSISMRVALNPMLSVSPSINIGVSFGYKASILEKPEKEALDKPYNRQLHALMFEATFEYAF